MATEQSVGTISSVQGSALIVSSDGSQRVAHEGDPVFLNDKVISPATGSVQITLNNGSPLNIVAGDQTLLDQAMLVAADIQTETAEESAEETNASAEDKTGEIEQIQQALAEGVDPSAVAEAPEAGENEEQQETTETSLTPDDVPIIERDADIEEAEQASKTAVEESSSTIALSSTVLWDEEEEQQEESAAPLNMVPETFLQDVSLDENLEVFSGQIEVRDGNPQDVHTFQLLTSTAQGELLLGSDGRYQFIPGDDFHDLGAGQSRTVSFSYEVTDSGGAKGSGDISFTVEGVNDAPEVDASITATADQETGLVVSDLLQGASDVDSGDVLSVSSLRLVSGNEAGVQFGLDGHQIDIDTTAYRYLAVGESEEIVYSYDVIDSHGTTVEQEAHFTITGTNDEPTVARDIVITSSEDQQNFNVDLLEHAADVDQSDTLTVTRLVVSAGDASGIIWNDNELQVDTAAYNGLGTGEEETITYDYTIEDGQGGEVEQMASITVQGVNDAPEDIQLSNAQINENDSGAVVGTLSTTDIDRSDSHAYEVSDNRFEVVGDQLKLKDNVLLDHETEASVTVTVTTTDSSNASFSKDFAITINDINEAPDTADTTVSTQEDTAFVLSLADFAFNDVDDGDRLESIRIEALPATGSLLLNGSAISANDSISRTDIESGLLTFTPQANESGDNYASFDFRVSDGELESDIQSVQINVTPVVDAPELTLSGDSNVVTSLDFESGLGAWTSDNSLETHSDGGAPGDAHGGNTFIELDKDGSPATPDALRYDVDTSNGKDHEVSLWIKQRDNYDSTDDVEVLWNGSVVATFDPTTTWGEFKVVLPNTGEATTELVIREPASQNEGVGPLLDDIEVRSLGIHESDDPAYQYAVSSNEDTAIPIDVSTALTDTDGSEVLAIELAGVPAGAELSDGDFTVTADGSPIDITGWEYGSLQVTPPENSHDDFDLTFRATATESATGQSVTIERKLKVAVQAVNDEPLIQNIYQDGDTEPASSFVVAENSNNGTAVGRVSASDVDGDTLTYSLTDDAGGRFEIDSRTGQISVLDSAGLNYEDSNSHSITVQVSDGELTDTRTYTVNLTDVNDAPEVDSGITATAVEDTVVFTVDLLEHASDEDGDTLNVANFTMDSGDVSGVSFSGNQITVDPDVYDSLADGETETLIFSYDVVDPDGAAVSQTAQVTITGTNDIPVLTAGGVLAYTENQGDTAVDPAITLTDVDSSSIESATVSVSSNFAADQDLLGFTDQNGITGSWDAGTGTLTLTGTASVADYQAALRSVTFLNNSESPDTSPRTISFVVSDGLDNSAVRTSQINITAVNDAPVVASDITETVAENSAATTVDLLAGASDVDIGDVLGVVNLVRLSGNATGLTADGNDLQINPDAYDYLADGQMEIVSYQYDIADGNGGSVTQQSTITITGTNDQAVISGVDTGSVTEDSGVSNNLISTSGTLTITDLDNGEDQFTPETLTGTYGNLTLDASGLWSWTGNNTQNAIQSLGNGDTLQDTFAVTAVDGTSHNIIVTINGTNDAPEITAGSTLSFTENQSAQAIDTALTLSDVDHTTLSGATISISGAYDSSEDQLDFTSQNGISGSWNVSSGTLTLSGTASVADYQSALRSVTYINNSESPDITDRTVSFTVSDGTDSSQVATSTVTVTAANDRPEDISLSNLSVTENNPGAVVGVLSVTDPDAGDSHTFIVDDLDFEVTNDFRLKLKDGRSLDHEVGDREIEVSVFDGDGLSYVETFTIEVLDINEDPTVSSTVDESALEDSGLHVVDLLAGATDQDDGDTLSVANITLLSGNDVGISMSGNTLSVDTDVYDYLPDTQTETITYQYDIVDGNGGSVTQTATITLTGTNDTATISGQDIRSVVEDDAATLMTSGTLMVADADSGEDQFVAETVNGTYGDLTINASGIWSYSADSSQADIQALGQGDTLRETLTVSSAEGTAHTVTITIAGSNDGAVITGTDTAVVTEDAASTLAASGSLNITDTDTGEASFNAETVSGSYGDLIINTAGDWSYSADNSQSAIQALGDGDSLTEVITVSSLDGTTHDITITINGANDAAVISGVDARIVQEDSSSQLTTSGVLTAVDIDTGEATFTPETINGNYGTLTAGVNGSWSYTADNSQAAIQSLGDGDTLTDTLTVSTIDGTTHDITITITGTNDAAVISGTDSAVLTEDSAATLTASGSLDITDADTGEASFEAETVSGMLGTLTIDTSGNWSYSADNSQGAIQSLQGGETITDTITVTALDGTTHEITIDINGTNDAAVIGGVDTATLVEDINTDAQNNLAASGQLSVTDMDGNEAAFNSATLTGTYGDLTIVLNGSWSYTADNSQADIQALPEGDTVTETFSVQTMDGTIHQITLTLQGVNDGAVIGGVDTAAITEDAAATLVATGSLTIADADTGEASFVTETISGSYGDLSLNTNGSWSYSADTSQADIQQLGLGDQLTETITVSALDGTSHNIVITINGTNDAAEIAGIDTVVVTEDSAATLTASGALTISDTDSGEASFVAATVSGNYGALTIDPSGYWSYTADNSQAAIQVLGDGDSLTETIEVLSADGTAHNIVVTINGTNDVAVIGGVDSAVVTEDAGATLTASGALTVTDTDTGEASFNAETVSGTYGSLTIDADGNWNYSADNSQLAIQQLDDGDVATDIITVSSLDGTTHQITISINGTNDAPVISAGISDQTATEEQAFSYQFPEAAFADIEGDTLTYSAELNDGSPLPGWISFDPDTRTFSGTPDDPDLGSLMVKVTASDGDLSTSTQFRISVTPVNDAPVVSAAINESTNEDVALTLTEVEMLANASDVDGDVLTLQNIRVDSGNVTITDNNDGTWTFTPAEDWSGTSQILFDVFDGTGTVTGTLNLDVDAQADLPITIVNDGSADGYFVETEEDAAIPLNVSIALADTDGSETLSVVMDLVPAGATVSDGVNTVVSDGSQIDINGWDWANMVLTPPPDHEEDFSVYIIPTATEASNDSSAPHPYHIRIDIQPANDAAIIGGVDTGSVTEDDFSSYGPLGEQQLIADGNLTISDVDDEASFVAETLTGTHGDLTINAGGQWQYIADSRDSDIQALGVTESLTDVITVQAVDGTTHDISVTIQGANDQGSGAPVYLGTLAEDNSLIINESSILNAVSDPDSDPLTLTSIQLPGNGHNIVNNNDGTWMLTPAPDFNGMLEMLYVVSDGTPGFEVNNLVRVNVTPVADTAIISGDDAGTVTEDAAATLTATGKLDVVDPDAGEAGFTAETVTGTYGSLTIDGSGNWSYAADNSQNSIQALSDGEVVTDELTVQSLDGTSHTVAVTVTGTNDAPVVGAALTRTIAEDTSFVITEAELLANVTDVEGESLTASNVRLDSGQAVVTDNGDNTWTITPNVDWSGNAQLLFDVTDGHTTVTGQVDVTVDAVADTPTIDLQPSEQITSMDFESGSLESGWNSANTPEINEASLYGVTDSSGGNGLIMDLDDDEGAAASTLDVLSYTIDTSNGFDHEVTFKVRARPGASNTSEMEVVWNGEVLQTIDPTTSWESMTIRLPAIDADSGVVELRELSGQNDDYGPLLDDIVINKLNVISATEDVDFDFSLNAALADLDGSESLSVSLEGIPSGYLLTDGLNSATSSGAAIDVSDWDLDTLSLAPATNANTDFTITVTATATEASTGETATTLQNILVEMLAVNDAATVGNVDLGQTDEDASFVITGAMLLANASDVDGDSLSISSVSLDNSAHGSLTDNGDNTWTFTPTSDFNGNDISFSFTVSDGTVGDEVNASATIDVTAVDDDAVVANPVGNQTATEDTAFSFVVPANTFTHADGDTLDYRASMADGSDLPSWLSFDAATRTFTGTPDNDDVATLNLKVTAIDDDNEETDASFNLGVNNVNDSPAPVFEQSDGLVSIEAEHFSSNVARSGNSWSVVSDGRASGGYQVNTANNDDEGFNENYTGRSSELTYDIQFESAGTYYVWLRGDAPDGRSDSVYIGLNGEAITTGSRIDFNESGHDWAGDRMDSAGRVTIEVDAPGTHQLNLWMREDGTAIDKIVISDDVDYVPSGSGPAESGYVGISDQTTAEESAFSYTIDVNAFRDADGTTPVLSAELVNGDPLPAWLSFDPGTRTFSGTPDDPDLGAIQVKVTASDGALDSSVNLNITVTNVNDAPVASADIANDTGSIGTLSSNSDQGVTVTASGNAGSHYQAFKAFDGVESDPANNQNSWAVDGSSGWLEVELPSAQRIGMYSIKAINSGARQPKDWEVLASTDGVNYTVIDTHSGVNNWSPRETKEFMIGDDGAYTHFKINITDNNGDSYTGFDGFQLFEWSSSTAYVEEDQTLSFDVLVNDSDVDQGDSLTLDAVEIVDADGNSLSGKGVASIVDGKLQFDPNGDFGSLKSGDSETVRVRYTISDDAGTQSTAITEVTVFGTEHAPTVSAVDLGSTDEDVAIVITKAQLLANASDLDGDALSVTNLSLADGAHGTLTDNGDDTWTFTPTANFHGNDIGLNYTVTDGTEGHNVAGSATIDVTSVNDGPDLVSDTNSGEVTAEGAAVSGAGSVLVNDSDIDGDALTVTAVNGTAVSGTTAIDGLFGSLSIAEDGNWTYTPASLDLDSDLVAHWTFNEASGSTAADTAPADTDANDGALEHGATFASGGVEGNAVQFDGNQALVDLVDSTELNDYSGGKSQRTINFEFKLDSDNDLSGRQILYEEGGSTNGYNLYIDDGTLYVGAWSETNSWNGTWLSTDISGMDSSGWHQVALVMNSDSNTLQAYLDGELVDSGSASAPMATHGDESAFGSISQYNNEGNITRGSTKFHDGSVDDPADVYGFDGFIDEARIYDRALTSHEINALKYEFETGTLQDVFTYTAPDGTDDASTTLTIDVNRAPEALSGTVTLGEDSAAIVGQLTAIDRDVGEILTFTPETQPASGTLTINPDGSYTFNPGSDFQDLAQGESRDVSFDYRVTDSQGDFSTNTVTITVTGANDGPQLAGHSMINSVTAAYSFDDATDASGNGNDITLSGSASLGAGHDGSGTAFEMNGSSGYGDLAGLQTGGAMSVSTWVKFDSFSQAWSRVFDFGNGQANENILIGHTGTTNTLGFHIYQGSGGGSDASLEISDFFTVGEWVHVTATIASDGTMSVYKNGELAGQAAGVVPAEMVRSNNYIGKSHWGGDGHLDGAVDEFAVYDEALTAEQVRAVYQADTVDNQLVDAFHIEENSSNTTSIGSVSATDTDTSDTLTYSLTDDAGGRFTINNSTGEITVADGNQLNHEDSESHTITIQVTDGITPVSRTYTVYVTDVNDAPDAADTSVAIDEGSSHTLTVADLGYSDEDGSALHSMQIISLPAAGSLTLNGVAVNADQVISKADIDAGLLVFTPAADDSGDSYAAFDFRLSDGELYSSTQTFTFDVIPVADAASLTVGDVATDGLVGFWNLDETSGTTAADNTGSTGDATLNNMSDADWVAGVDNNALEFDGTDDYLSVSSELSPVLGGTSTLSFWINTTDSDSSAGIMGISKPGDNDIAWGQLDANGYISLNVGEQQGAISTTAVNDGSWHHVVITRDEASGETQVYVDGQLENEVVADTGLKTESFSDIGRVVEHLDEVTWSHSGNTITLDNGYSIFVRGNGSGIDLFDSSGSKVIVRDNNLYGPRIDFNDDNDFDKSIASRHYGGMQESFVLSDGTKITMDIGSGDYGRIETLTITKGLQGMEVTGVNTSNFTIHDASLNGVALDAALNDGNVIYQNGTFDTASWYINSPSYTVSTTGSYGYSPQNTQEIGSQYPVPNTEDHFFKGKLDSVRVYDKVLAADEVREIFGYEQNNYDAWIDGQEDVAIDIDIAAALTDTDGSEVLAVELAGVPSGATLSDGSNSVVSTGADVDISSWNLATLQVIPAANNYDDFTLTVNATSTEHGNNDQVTVSKSIRVDMQAVNDAPTAADNTISMNEDATRGADGQ